jgi:NAD(P)-dependent dehydrogenase (short-subunit alcohol dehydrogenase family)
MSRTVLITGGSGALGSALVRKFATLGDRVFFTFHRNETMARELTETTGAVAIQADLTLHADVEALFQRIQKVAGSVEVLVNNAGLTQVMPFALIEEEDWDRVLDGCLKTLFLVTKEAVRGMIGAKRGNIVNIGSIAGKRLLEVPVHYATAKSAISGFTLSLAKELSRYHIRVNAVIPGMLDDGVSSLVPEKQKAEFRKFCLAGRTGGTHEVAEAVAFLASDASSYINAQELVVDGGL